MGSIYLGHSLYWASVGKVRQGKVNRLQLASFKNFCRLWGIGLLGTWPWDDKRRGMLSVVAYSPGLMKADCLW